jgi:hypothetical protein
VFKTKLQIQEALSRTGRRMALADAGEYSLLVCGGSALNLAGLIERPTRDVDVLGLVKGPNHDSVVAEIIPEEVTRAAEAVATDLNLPQDWLNDAALEVHRLGLPAGVLERAEKCEFGPCLTVYLLSRQDQVALKLYAAIDRTKGQRHLKDLLAINPKETEMELAVHWLLDRKTSPQFRQAVAKICKALGFLALRNLDTAGMSASTRQQPRGTSGVRRKAKNN